MFKKLILASCLFALCFTISSAGIVDKLKTVIARKSVAAGASPDCSEDFTNANTDDVAGNTIFETETDASSKLQIISNKLNYLADTDSYVGQVVDTSGCLGPSPEMTIKFKIEFDDVTTIGADSDYLTWLDIRNSGGTQIAACYFELNASGDVGVYYCYRGAFAEKTATEVTMSGITINTQYECIFYESIHASTGTVSIKCGAWAETNTGTDDTSGYSEIAEIRYVATGGTIDGGANIKFDDFEVYQSDQR